MDKLYVISRKKLKYDNSMIVLNNHPLYIFISNKKNLDIVLKNNEKYIKKYYFDLESLNPLLEYEDYSFYKCRIEKGAVIRKNVLLDETSIVLMGAVINMNASIGRNTMIDMNAVVGSGAIIKDNVHISAGVVISGVLEPISNKPVIIEDDVFIGANSVIKEGVHIGKGAIIGASSFVNKDIKENSLNYGVPCKFIRNVLPEDISKVSINKSLRRNKFN